MRSKRWKKTRWQDVFAAFAIVGLVVLSAFMVIWPQQVLKSFHLSEPLSIVCLMLNVFVVCKLGNWVIRFIIK